NVERYLGELFQVPVGVCIADTQDIVRDALGYEISDMHREPISGCVTAFQYVARIEWARWNDRGSWRLMYALYRRESDRSRFSKPVEEAVSAVMPRLPRINSFNRHRRLRTLQAGMEGAGSNPGPAVLLHGNDEQDEHEESDDDRGRRKGDSR